MGWKICVYAICKNESAFVDRWMDSMGEADMVVVTDTGSEDDTMEKLIGRGAVVYSESISPWRFDRARNISLNHLPEDTDICVCADLDEVFSEGWREKLEGVWKPCHTQASYLFTWEFNQDNTPRKQSIKEKIHRRHGFKWAHPVHEVLEYTGDDKENSVFVPGLVVNHYPDLTKPRTQYLPLLELSADENPDDSQTVFWLGREYFYNGMYKQCIDTLKKYLALPSACWAEERSWAMSFLSSAYDLMGNRGEAKAWLYKAIGECPGLREPYLRGARLGYSQGDWPMTYAMVKKGLAITSRSTSYLADTECFGYPFYDLGAISSYWLGLLKESCNYAQIAAALQPENKRLQNNLRFIEEALQARGGVGNG